MAVQLILTSVIMFACVLLNKISTKLGFPMLLAFILLGMFFGSDGIVKIPFDDYVFAERICSVALIFIMFYGGFGTNWQAAKLIVAKSVLLSSLGVVLTAAFTGLFCRLALGFNWQESFLTGSVIASTDAASVFSILRSKRLNLKYNTASILEVESGSNDPFAYMLTAVILSVMTVKTTAGDVIYMIFAQIVYSIAFGIAISVASGWLLKRIKFTVSGFDAIFVTAIAVLSYAAPAAIGGNGYLCTYIVGIVLGNSEIRNKKTLVPFFDGVTGLMQMLLFFLLGLLSFPLKILQVFAPSFFIALFITFIGRPLAVFSILTPFRSKLSQQLVVSWAGLRGAASIVFSVMAMSVVQTEDDIFHIVFGVVLFSILIQGSLLPYISRKLNMIDASDDVMKTFSDYSDEIPVQFIQFSVVEGHPWCNLEVKDIILPPDTLLVLLQRGNEKLVPNGKTVLTCGDKIILSAKSPAHVEGINLTEKQVEADSSVCNKRISEAVMEKDALIVLIMRKNNIIIPNGNTVIKRNDILVINRTVSIE